MPPTVLNVTIELLSLQSLHSKLLIDPRPMDLQGVCGGAADSRLTQKRGQRRVSESTEMGKLRLMPRAGSRGKAVWPLDSLRPLCTPTSDAYTSTGVPVASMRRVTAWNWKGITRTLSQINISPILVEDVSYSFLLNREGDVNLHATVDAPLPTLSTFSMTSICQTLGTPGATVAQPGAQDWVGER